MEKEEEKLNEMKGQEAGRGPEVSSQARQPQEPQLEMGAADAEGKARKPYTGVCGAQMEIKGQPSLCAFLAPSSAATMETLSSCCTNSLSEMLPNGYVAQVIPDHPEIESLTREVGLEELEKSEQYDQSDLSTREESGWNKEKTKVSQIWNFVSYRKGASSQEKQPQVHAFTGRHLQAVRSETKLRFMD